MKIIAYVGNWGMLPPPRAQAPGGTKLPVKSAPEDTKLGIQVFEYSSEDGALQEIQLVTPAISVGAANISPNKKTFYALDEKKDAPGRRGGGGGGTVVGYSVDEETGGLTEKKKMPSYGVFPSYICISEDGRYAIVTNHGGGRNPITKTVYEDGVGYQVVTEFDEGNVVLIGLNKDGQPKRVLDIDKHTGSSVGKSQFSPHPHTVHQIPGENLFVVTDKGNDSLYMYRVNEDKLCLCDGSPLRGPEGCAPRYLALHPTAPYFYVINENKTVLTIVHYDRSNGQMEIEGTVDSLPAEQPKNASDEQKKPVSIDPSDIVIRPDGKYLYASNRNINVLCAFAVSQDGAQLKLLQTIPCGGENPRGLAIVPDGRYLLVANVDSAAIHRFSIDPSSGLLTDAGTAASAYRPANIRFAVFS